MIILIGGIKGGCGKTTLAVNLAVYSAMNLNDTLLVDADDQQTATDFTEMRNRLHPDLVTYTSVRLSEEAVMTEVRKLSDKYKHIIIDTGGRDTSSQRAALAVCDIAVVPFIPRAFDIWTMNKLVAMVEEIRPFNTSLELYACLNKADSCGTSNQEAKDTIEENGNFLFIPDILVSRKIYCKAASYGLSVLESEPRDHKAYDEFDNFARGIINE